MNLWIVTHTNDASKLTAIVVALTPVEARALVSTLPSFVGFSGNGECKQLGTAASNLRTPHVVLSSLTLYK